MRLGTILTITLGHYNEVKIEIFIRSLNLPRELLQQRSLFESLK